MRLALQQPPWSLTNHRSFPPAFQAAARAFLLVAGAGPQRRRQHLQQLEGRAAMGTEQAGCCLGDLPAPFLEKMLGLAAYPLSAWL